MATTTVKTEVKQQAKAAIAEALKKAAQADVMDLLTTLRVANKRVEDAQKFADDVKAKIKEREESLAKEIEEYTSL